ncbi:hypothetical protein [Leisingera sp. D0M16]|uniref:hypothetical protein n=1 Tax=Leisingera coralii TaxID=3351347 RepID=UPI003B9F6884
MQLNLQMASFPQVWLRGMSAGLHRAPPFQGHALMQSNALGDRAMLLQEIKATLDNGGLRG